MPSHFCHNILASAGFILYFIEQSECNNLQKFLECCRDKLVSLVHNCRNNLNQPTSSEALNRVDSVFD